MVECMHKLMYDFLQKVIWGPQSLSELTPKKSESRGLQELLHQGLAECCLCEINALLKLEDSIKNHSVPGNPIR